MSGITGLGTTYDLPNYTGILFGLTPADTPLFSAIGGLTGGMQSTSTEFEWETYDLRDAAQNVALEGATAPTAQERVRGNVTNVCQIQQEKVSISYSKIAAYGQKAGSNNALPNPVTNETDFQVTTMLKQMVRDVEWSFINGVYVKPSDNNTARKTRGLIAAAGNTSQAGTVSAALSAATDTITEATTPVADGKGIVFLSVGVATTIVTHRVYYVVAKAAGSFKVAATPGGTPIVIGTATVMYVLPSATATATSDIDSFLQGVYDNGGITESSTATLICNSRQKRAISTAYASAYGKFVESNRNVGGVNVNTIVTDFGTLNVMLNRFVPQDALLVASLEQLAPVFLEIPGKGHFFAEPLAKTGASDEVQLYGEVGLAYGSTAAQGYLRGLAF